MDSLLATLGWEYWKPVLTALALPPVPLLLLVVIGARRLSRQRRGGWTMLWLALIALWFGSTSVFGSAMQRWLLRPPPPLTETQISALKQLPAQHKLAVVILGGGRELLAPEYAEASLAPRSMQRLHYGLWLARRLNAPVLFSGGVGLAQADGPAEADIAARIAERDYGRRLRWTENGSRDTRENAAASLSLLLPEGITDVVIVTHGWHMPRALRAFRAAAQRNAPPLQVTPASMGLARDGERPVLRWLPSPEGFAQVRQVLRESLGMLMGA